MIQVHHEHLCPALRRLLRRRLDPAPWQHPDRRIFGCLDRCRARSSIQQRQFSKTLACFHVSNHFSIYNNSKLATLDDIEIIRLRVSLANNNLTHGNIFLPRRVCKLGYGMYLQKLRDVRVSRKAVEDKLDFSRRLGRRGLQVHGMMAVDVYGIAAPEVQLILKPEVIKGVPVDLQHHQGRLCFYCGPSHVHGQERPFPEVIPLRQDNDGFLLFILASSFDHLGLATVDNEERMAFLTFLDDDLPSLKLLLFRSFRQRVQFGLWQTFQERDLPQKGLNFLSLLPLPKQVQGRKRSPKAAAIFGAS
mmetsp:Transcript_3242/g.7664  ORF Transcript_3242/g.7664 Transcript_3242/m.7664 type:complete len:305 (-) Transcript_3242:121-1035(-)